MMINLQQNKEQASGGDEIKHPEKELRQAIMEEYDSIPRQEAEQMVTLISEELGEDFIAELAERELKNQVSAQELIQIYGELYANKQAFEKASQSLFEIDEQEEDELLEIVSKEAEENAADTEISKFFLKQKQETIIVSEQLEFKAEELDMSPEYFKAELDIRQYQIEKSIEGYIGTKNLTPEIREKLTPTLVNNLGASFFMVALNEITGEIEQAKADGQITSRKQYMNFLEQNYPKRASESEGLLAFKTDALDGVIQYLETNKKNLDDIDLEAMKTLMIPSEMIGFYTEHKTKPNVSEEMTKLLTSSTKLEQQELIDAVKQSASVHQEMRDKNISTWNELPKPTQFDNMIEQGSTLLEAGGKYLEVGLNGFTTMLNQFPEVVMLWQYIGELMSGDLSIEEFNNRLEMARMSKMDPAETRAHQMIRKHVDDIKLKPRNLGKISDQLFIEEDTWSDFDNSFATTHRYRLGNPSVRARVAANIIKLSSDYRTFDANASYLDPSTQVPTRAGGKALLGVLVAKYKEEWEDYNLSNEQFNDAIKLLIVTGKEGPSDYYFTKNNIKKKEKVQDIDFDPQQRKEHIAQELPGDHIQGFNTNTDKITYNKATDEVIVTRSSDGGQTSEVMCTISMQEKAITDIMESDNKTKTENARKNGEFLSFVENQIVKGIKTFENKDGKKDEVESISSSLTSQEKTMVNNALIQLNKTISDFTGIYEEFDELVLDEEMLAIVLRRSPDKNDNPDVGISLEINVATVSLTTSEVKGYLEEKNIDKLVAHIKKGIQEGIQTYEAHLK